MARILRDRLESQLLVKLSNSRLEQVLVLLNLQGNNFPVGTSNTNLDQSYQFFHHRRFLLGMEGLGLEYRLGSNIQVHR